MANDLDIDNTFSYHAPTPEQLPKYEALRAGAKAFAQVIVEQCPPSADRTAAVRKLREAVMTANASIALAPPALPHAEGDPATVVVDTTTA
jgi:hypothetical protein